MAIQPKLRAHFNESPLQSADINYNRVVASFLLQQTSVYKSNFNRRIALYRKVSHIAKNNIKFIWEHFWKVAKTICSYCYEHARHNLHRTVNFKNED